MSISTIVSTIAQSSFLESARKFLCDWYRCICSNLLPHVISHHRHFSPECTNQTYISWKKTFGLLSSLLFLVSHAIPLSCRSRKSSAPSTKSSKWNPIITMSKLFQLKCIESIQCNISCLVIPVDFITKWIMVMCMVMVLINEADDKVKLRWAVWLLKIVDLKNYMILSPSPNIKRPFMNEHTSNKSIVWWPSSTYRADMT